MFRLGDLADNWLRTFLFFVSVYIIYNSFLLRVLEHSRIRRLGHHSHRIYGWIPGDLDLLFQSIRSTMKGSDLIFWGWVFSQGNGESQTAEFRLGGQRFVFTADTENVKAILATQFNEFGKGPGFHDAWRDFLGDSIFTTDGDLWHHSRHLIRPQFVKNRIKDLELIERHVTKLIGHMGGNGKVVDIGNLFYRYTIDVAMDYLLDFNVNSLDEPEAKFADAFAEVQRVQNMIARTGPANVMIPRRSFHAKIQIMNSFVEPIIDHALRLNPDDLKASENQSFLYALAATGIRDRQFLRDQIVAVLLAGRDTTAGSLSFLLLEFSRHPEIVAKLRQEIDQTVGRDRGPTYEDLKGMRYLQNCLNEVLRLYPSVPFNVREALKDTTLPTGGGPAGNEVIGVPQGTPVIYSSLYMQRHSSIYPPPSPTFAPADIFSPDRWDTWQPKPWQYIPFNGGPRICIGQQFALTEMGYTIVRILQQFEKIDRHWRDEGDGAGPLFKCEVVLAPARAFDVGFWRRN